jgi:hypothetical protein
MEAKLSGNRLVIKSNEKFKNESAVWFALKNLLNSKGLDVVKKQAWQDGHMIPEGVYYLRDRKWKFYFFDDLYQVRNIGQDLNKMGEAHIMVVWNSDTTNEKVISMLS